MTVSTLQEKVARVRNCSDNATLKRVGAGAPPFLGDEALDRHDLHRETVGVDNPAYVRALPRSRARLQLRSFWLWLRLRLRP